MLPAAGGETPHFPMRVGEFLRNADLFLHRGDIILSRNGSIWSRIIRFVTGGFFSHSAFVFLVPQRDNGLDHTFVLESISSGVGLDKFDRWVSGKSRSEEVAIVRLDGPEFHETFFKIVAGIMLDEVKSSYDFGRAVSLGFSVWFGLRQRLSRITHRQALKYKPWMPANFICSGFIQFGLVEAMRRALKPASSVVLKPGVDAADKDGLLDVSPEDIARSDKVTWIFVIRGGWVHQVDGYAQAQRIIAGVQ